MLSADTCAGSMWMPTATCRVGSMCSRVGGLPRGVRTRSPSATSPASASRRTMLETVWARPVAAPTATRPMPSGWRRITSSTSRWLKSPRVGRLAPRSTPPPPAASVQEARCAAGAGRRPRSPGRGARRAAGAGRRAASAGTAGQSAWAASVSSTVQDSGGRVAVSRPPSTRWSSKTRGVTTAGGRWHCRRAGPARDRRAGSKRPARCCRRSRAGRPPATPSCRGPVATKIAVRPVSAS